jgi:hypothetical protein
MTYVINHKEVEICPEEAVPDPGVVERPPADD